MQNFNFKKNPTVFEGRDDIFKKMCAKAIKGPSLARSVPKPLKGPSLARSVPKPLKEPSLSRSVLKPFKMGPDGEVVGGEVRGTTSPSQL